MNNYKEFFECKIIDNSKVEQVQIKHFDFSQAQLEDPALDNAISNLEKELYKKIGIECDAMILKDAIRKAKIYDSLFFIFKCPFEVVLEAFKNGIIDEKGKHRDVSLHYGKVRCSMKEYYFDAYDYDNTIILPLRDYLYTWWLPSDKRVK